MKIGEGNQLKKMFLKLSQIKIHFTPACQQTLQNLKLDFFFLTLSFQKEFVPKDIFLEINPL